MPACPADSGMPAILEPVQLFDATLVESFVNVVNNHGSDGFSAMGLRQQIVRQSGCSYIGDVFMLADRSDLVLIETTQADAIFQLDHG
jgi:hypothetical protein